MKVSEARKEINEFIKKYNVNKYDISAVRDHWFWATLNLEEDDEFPEQEYEDIWDHLKWYSAAVEK